MNLYIPKHFSSNDKVAIEEVINKNPFATLISTPEGQEAIVTHLQINRLKDGKFYGHFARANSHSNVSGPAKIIFSGPHAYISPNWFISEHNVPTWNYGVVHLTGNIDFIDDPDRTWEILNELVSIYEGPQGWELPKEEFYHKMTKALRVFEFQVTHIDAKFKYSQNKKQSDRQSIANKLREQGEDQVADMMDKFTS
ncbi:FMN-binding negative transcriptional regulator [Motiliproteus sp. MSK22-1]|uniref:FMN-binding negative transcriptional regulator n=1 Tax=Motiliproteus sp. MSK22-1 TaxID=1897630 RepID=UPI0009753D97|nr:FMN-binding negative transcriptional regulator [Motiliproteus sp. MSK22-1]OMH33992.1 hypothetical protein BGP75_13605 [Motiliproteus sp. MSK22-1]